MNVGQKILAVIGVLGLVLLTPVIFYTFGNAEPIDFLADKLGALGNPSVLTFISFCLIGTAALLGGGKNFSATLVSMLIGCLFISTAVEISFLTWFKDLVSNVEFLSNLKLNMLAGLFVLLFGMFLSYSEKMSFKAEVLALVIVPLVFLVGSSYAGILPNNTEFKISMNEGINSLAGMIDEKYMSQESVQEYVENIEKNDTLSQEEKIAKIEELQGKIKKMESEEEMLVRLKEENEKYKELIKSQEDQIKNLGYCAGSRDSSAQVRIIGDAVVPRQPCVRDFAVSLVKEEQGAYYDVSFGTPGVQGLKQICNLHYHLSSNWKYISDPTMIRNDYFSPADRTIALGLAGDCDDFAVMNASCVEAIGGVSRIMIGFCGEGAHAWAEVWIGTKSDWDKATKTIRSHYSDKGKELIPSIDVDGGYWLPLDWRMGQFRCNDNPHKMEEWYSSKSQLDRYKK